MSAAVALAFAAAALGVPAAWELAAAVEQAAVVAAVGRALAPLRRRGAQESPEQEAARRRLVVVLGLSAGVAAWLVAGVVVAIAATVAVPWALGRAVAARRERWRAGLAAGAPAAARSLADALAAGRSIRGAVTAAAAAGGCGRAADAELADAAGALALGAPTDEVLERLRRRAAAPAWDTIVAAVLLQRDAGGDLAGLLRAIAADLEASRRVEAQARTATAQARTTARIVGGLPVGAAMIAELAAPGTLAHVLARPLSALPALGAAALEIIGVVLVRRLARP